MYTKQSKVGTVPKEIEAARILNKLKLLMNEALMILLGSGEFSLDYLSALSFRIHEYITRELRTLYKQYKSRYLGYRIVLPIKRPKRPTKLDIPSLDLGQAYH